jgi:hypothetical protein
MAVMIDLVKAKAGDVMRPIFISCDPARDTPAVVRAYLKEFHPDILGLTGTWEETKAICKAYRVYFSTPPDVKPGQDYLVDHSIYFYLMGKWYRTPVHHSLLMLNLCDSRSRRRFCGSDRQKFYSGSSGEGYCRSHSRLERSFGRTAPLKFICLHHRRISVTLIYVNYL